MSNPNDLEYFARRASAERELSERASDPAAALIHLKLARRYERLAADEPTRPTLHMVNGRA